MHFAVHIEKKKKKGNFFDLNGVQLAFGKKKKKKKTFDVFLLQYKTKKRKISFVSLHV